MSDYCPHEKSLVDIGGGKSFCTRLNKWTNCREVSHCVADDLLNKPDAETRLIIPRQLSLFFLERYDENEQR